MVVRSQTLFADLLLKFTFEELSLLYTCLPSEVAKPFEYPIIQANLERQTKGKLPLQTKRRTLELEN